MNYRSFSDLNKTIHENLHRIPRDIDIVIGIPRSGLLPATLIALALNLPIADIEGFASGRTLASGKTRRRAELDVTPKDARHVLVIDDSLRTGTAMDEARKKLQAAFPGKKFTYAAIYGTQKNPPGGEMVFDVIPDPRIFQWNVMHHIVLSNACVDIDGVLCMDPTEEQNDDGTNYLAFLESAVPLHLPTMKIGTLVTSRLEKYRSQTEAWLKSQNIDYDKLVMMDLPDAKERRRQGSHGQFKGEVYRKSMTCLFIESDRWQAQEIARISGKPVLCIEGPKMFYPHLLSPLANAQKVYHSRTLRLVARAVVGKRLYEKAKKIRSRLQ